MQVARYVFRDPDGAVEELLTEGWRVLGWERTAHQRRLPLFAYSLPSSSLRGHGSRPG
jgi:hypothetical protein